jgi:hypothetical protein
MTDIIIPKRLQKFFNDHEIVINTIFNILKKYKPNIVDAYLYSSENRPPHPKYKYTEKLYLGCILYVIKYGVTWESFIGPIPGKQLNKRHNEYINRYDIYSKFFNYSLKKYLKTHNIKYLSIDSTIVNNKNCSEFNGRLPYNKNRKGGKIEVIGDDKGSPLIFSISESTKHDSKIAINDINKLSTNKIINEALKKTKGHPYILADSGYDSSNLKEKLKIIHFKGIIKPNNRNTKHAKKRKLSKSDNKKYKKRITIEGFFGIIKKYPKINCIYERKIVSYNGLISFLFGAILLGRINNK